MMRRTLPAALARACSSRAATLVRTLCTAWILAGLALATSAACKSSSSGKPVQSAADRKKDTQASDSPREKPPKSGPSTDVSFPAIERRTLANGLELNLVQWNQLPVLYLQLVIKSGGETDPQGQPGLSRLVAALMKEGTKQRSSSKLANDVDFLGADLSTYSDEENLVLTMRALSDNLEQALGILAEVATQPRFADGELKKLRKRELDRLRLSENNPEYLARRALYKELYGEHPYAHIDTTAEVVKNVRRSDIAKWHKRYAVPNNASLVVVGDFASDALSDTAQRVFKRWRKGKVTAPEYPAPPERSERRVVIVDRPGSVQTVIRMGNLALPRQSPDFVALAVANQVLGGSAASRLFMDLREKRSLTYGAYSSVRESVQAGPFAAGASVRTKVTGEALDAFLEHLKRIRQKTAPKDELAKARRYLSDRFPLEIDSPGKIAAMVARLRIFGLPDDYWDSYRSQIRQISPEEALAAAQKYIQPDAMVVVLVGEADKIRKAARKVGPVHEETSTRAALSTADLR